MRDNFGSSVVRHLANRAGHRCSNPDCRRETSGPDASSEGSVNIGVAAHISAAAPGGPRFDDLLAPAERASLANGIWLCQTCAKLIDSDLDRFTKDVLAGWKKDAEYRAQSLLQTPEDPRLADGPVLHLPQSDRSVSWLPFSARATTFVGRKVERDQLKSFLEAGAKFSWLLLTGAGGSGKSRLGLEFCHAMRPQWRTGFLSRTETFDNWSHFRPENPTLIVVDYVSSRAAQIGSLVLQLSRSAPYLPSPVRLLLIERDEGAWWSRFVPADSLSESAEMLQCRHSEPIRLGPLEPEALLAIAGDIASSRGMPWSESIAQEFQRQMRFLDPLQRPLFTMMAAGYSGGAAGDAVMDSEVLRRVLDRESGRRRALVPDGDQLRKMECLITLATLVGGLMRREGGFGFVADSHSASILPHPDQLDFQNYQSLVPGAGDDTILSGLQPDILGERFVLDQLATGRGNRDRTKKLVRTAWELQPGDLIDFVVRVASDFPGDSGVDALCELPLDSAKSRAAWGFLVGSLIVAANRSSDQRTQRLLEDLRLLANRHSEEPGLQESLGRAEFALGNVLLFEEGNVTAASSQFDVAIARAGAQSEIGAAAINNRGIAHHQAQDKAKAFADWCEVIATERVADEARACALNNRADVFAQRGAHEDAIRDRSAVLALRETSRDRRFIALFRRSQSYVVLKKLGPAFADLKAIFDSEDISVLQKSEALIERGLLLRDLGELHDAREDLEAVLTRTDLTLQMASDALLGLADVARLERNFDEALRYLDVISEGRDVPEVFVIEGLLIRSRLLLDKRDVASAEAIWQSIAANPGATARQKVVASSRGADPAHLLGERDNAGAADLCSPSHLQD
jgi:tetratricopeptide (TPR) repeat protein